MATIASLTRESFSARLGAASAAVAGREGLVDRLYAHFEELRRWAPRVDLIGPGIADELVERHYAEALAGVAWIPRAARRLLDLGSGAGFPGFVLAAARPDLDTWLVEPRARKAAFLAAAARRARLAVHIVNARVAAASLPDLPADIDLLTMRALRLDSRSYLALVPLLSPGARLLAWSGEEAPRLPPPFEPSRAIRLAGSARRYLREFVLAKPPA